MPDIPTMSLKAAPLQFAAFTPVQYTPQTADPTLLAKSLAIQEAREEKAEKRADAIDNALVSFRTNLNEAEHDWFDSKANEIRDRLDTQIALGNYQSAIRIAQSSARDLIRDTELQNKVQYNAARNKTLEKIKSRSDINADTKKAVDLLNTYNYDGSPEYTPVFDPESSMSMADIAARVASLTPERGDSTQTGGSKSILLTAVGAQTNNLSEASFIGGHTGGKHSNSINEKDPDRLETMFKNIIASDGKINAALKQQFDVSTILYKDVAKKLENPNLSDEERTKLLGELDKYKREITNADGIVITSYDKWLKQKAIPIIRDLSYRRKTTTDINESAYNEGLIAANAERAERYKKLEEDDDLNPAGVVEVNYAPFATKNSEYKPQLITTLGQLFNSFHGNNTNKTTDNEAVNDAQYFD